MRPGEESADRNWDHKGKRVVGPYINDGGWRRMGFNELLYVELDKRWSEPPPSIDWAACGFRSAAPPLDDDYFLTPSWRHP